MMPVKTPEMGYFATATSAPINKERKKENESVFEILKKCMMMVVFGVNEREAGGISFEKRGRKRGRYASCR